MTDHVLLSDLVENPDNPRSSLGDLTELAANIAAIGVITPLLVVEQDSRYVVVDGHRRLAAIRTIPSYDAPIPVRVVVMDRTERLIAALTAGVHTRTLDPLDEAMALRALLDEHGITQMELAHRLGFSQARVAKRLRLLDLPASLKSDLLTGRISYTAAYKQVSQHRSPRVVPPPPRSSQPAVVARIADKDAVDLTGDHRLAYLDLIFEGRAGQPVTWRDATKDDHKEAVRVLAGRLSAIQTVIQKHNSSVAQLSRSQARTLADIYGVSED